MLKWQYQPDYRQTAGEASWRASLRNQRTEIAAILADSPGLRWFILQSVAEVYQQAVDDAAEDTGMPASLFPANCPCTIEQVLDRNFYPEP